MKFFTLCIVAVLAVTVAANAIHQPAQPGYPGNPAHHGHESNLESYQTKSPDFGTDIVEVCGRFYELVKKFAYSVFEKVATYLPGEFRVAFENLFKYWPSFNQFFTPEFYAAIKDFVRALKKFFMPHHFFGFIDNALKALPTITEFLPEGFFLTVARYLEHIPFAKECVKQWYEIMQELIPHQYQY